MTSRPAETAALTAALAVLVAYFVGIDDPGVLAALLVVIGALPGVVTWLVVTFRGGKGATAAGKPKRK